MLTLATISAYYYASSMYGQRVQSVAIQKAKQEKRQEQLQEWYSLTDNMDILRRDSAS